LQNGSEGNIAMALAKGARQRGASVIENVKVTKVHSKNGSVSGVSWAKGDEQGTIARERMMHELRHGLTAAERRFLLSLVAAEPEGPLLGVAHVDQLPGLQWKLQNLEHLRTSNAQKFATQAEALARLFE
jgi:hypothetical protein